MVIGSIRNKRATSSGQRFCSSSCSNISGEWDNKKLYSLVFYCIFIECDFFFYLSRQSGSAEETSAMSDHIEGQIVVDDKTGRRYKKGKFLGKVSHCIQ